MAGRKKLDKSDLRIASLCRDFTEEGVEILKTIARGGEKDSDKIAAIKEINDRGWGKAAQPIVGDEDKPLEMTIKWKS